MNLNRLIYSFCFNFQIGEEAYKFVKSRAKWVCVSFSFVWNKTNLNDCRYMFCVFCTVILYGACFECFSYLLSLHELCSEWAVVVACCTLCLHWLVSTILQKCFLDSTLKIIWRIDFCAEIWLPKGKSWTVGFRDYM